MGVAPENTDRQPSGTPGAEAASLLTQSQGGMRAQQLIDSRLTTLHADVAVRAAQRFEELHPLPDQKVTEAIKNCIRCLTDLSQDNALTRDPVAIEECLVPFLGASQCPSSASKLPTKIQKALQLGATLTVRSRKIEILLEGLALVTEHPGLDKVTKGASRVLTEVRELINSGTLPAAKAAQRHLDKNRVVLAGTASGLLAMLDDTKPERREALRKAYIDQSFDKEDTNYRSSLEHKALKLLSLVQGRHEHPDNRPAQVKIARRLLSLGSEKVEQNLRNLTPTLLLEEGDVSELKEIFEEARVSESQSESAEGDPSEPVVQGPTKRSLKQNAASRRASDIRPSRSKEGEETYSPPPALEDAATIAFKRSILEELGIKDADLRTSISNELRLEGLEFICTAFSVLPEGVARAILGVNPNLISPSSGENLLTFTSDLQEFLRGAYDLGGYTIFNPMTSPQNFASPSRLKRTKAMATVLRRASRRV